MVREMLNSDINLTKVDNLFYQTGFTKNDFESTYIAIRKKEGRIFLDSEVKTLPEISFNHPLYREWRIRKRSTQRLINYIQRKRVPVKILEIGCGNGWLSHNLSLINDSEVIGIDVNETELRQAASVFNGLPNLTFILGDIASIKLPFQFDFIIFASSIQYFDDLEKIFDAVRKFSTSNAEIHILDTPIYESSNVNQAKKRSADYFCTNASEMRAHYFHHTWKKLEKYNPTRLYDPRSPVNRLKTKLIADSPFPWIRIK